MEDGFVVGEWHLHNYIHNLIKRHVVAHYHAPFGCVFTSYVYSVMRSISCEPCLVIFSYSVHAPGLRETISDTEVSNFPRFCVIYYTERYIDIWYSDPCSCIFAIHAYS